MAVGNGDFTSIIVSRRSRLGIAVRYFCFICRIFNRFTISILSRQVLKYINPLVRIIRISVGFRQSDRITISFITGRQLNS